MLGDIPCVFIAVVVEGDAVEPVPHRAHWQPVDYNALHGGIQRWYVPLAQEMVTSPAWSALLLGLARITSAFKGERLLAARVDDMAAALVARLRSVIPAPVRIELVFDGPPDGEN